jgi:hypothetical protein
MDGIQEIRVLQTPQNPNPNSLDGNTATYYWSSGSYLPTYLKSKDRPFYYLKQCQIMMASWLGPYERPYTALTKTFHYNRTCP